MIGDRVLMTNAAMRALDAASVQAGVPIRTLMERAGAAVAEAIRRRYTRRPTLVLCGPGANGGDGLVAARLLAAAGWPVRVAALEPRRVAHHVASSLGLPINQAEVASFDDAALIVDALFGAGLSRPLDGLAAALAQATGGRIVTSIDVPSGVHGDGAAPCGPTFSADLTVTFERKKPAHVLEPSRSLCGEVVVSSIGIPCAAFLGLTDAVKENWPELFSWPAPSGTVHKHKRGHVLVVSGPSHRTGAARLAAQAALRTGAGLVTLASPPGALLENAAHLTAIMLARYDDPHTLAALAKSSDVVVVGPALGVGPAAKANIEALLETDRPLVLDADVFTVFADDPSALFAKLAPTRVLTPHLGEFKRLFGQIAADYSKLDAALAAAKRAGSVVLLKGPDTVIAAPNGQAVVNTTSSPHLATAGSGDVLAGAIAGLMAQGMSGFDAAAAGAWLHGRAGIRLGRGLTAEDLADALPRAYPIK
jgi:hydroxyethylthiazole kinase-like uncharacterized protein yjeF